MFEPKFSITNMINNYLLRIERARGFLDAAELKEEWIKKMQSEALILEAHHSTHIEGTQLTLSQAQKILTGKLVKGVKKDDRLELLNYREAMDFVSEYLGKKSEITVELIKKIHRILVRNVRGGTLEPGKYRKIQNYIVDSLTKEIIYTPPLPFKVSNLMNDFVKWLNKDTNISPILMAGISQFQFVHIHPFLDGNGRTARVLCTLILYQNGYDFKRLFSLSEYYDKNRRKYYDAIQSVRNNNMDMTEWLEYFTEGLKAQMSEIQEKGKKVIKQDIILNKAEKLRLNKRQVKALKFIIGNESMTVQNYLKLSPKISRRTAQRDLKDMIKKGFIKRKGSTNKLAYILI